MQSLKEDEVFDDALSPEELLHRLYHSSKLVITKNKEYRFGCRCSRDKLLNTLTSFGEEEINNLADSIIRFPPLATSVPKNMFLTKAS